MPRTADGDRVLTPAMQGSGGPVGDFNPGQTIRYRFNLARLFDLSRAGDYTVSVSRHLRPWVHPRPIVVTPQQEIALSAGPLKIHMVEDPAAKSDLVAFAPMPAHRTFLYVANQYGGAVARLLVGEDGRPSPTLAAPASAGEGSGAVAATPDGRFLYVGNGSVGTDYTVSQFRIGPDGQLSPLSPPKVPAQKFPGFLLMDPKSRFLLALSGWGSTLYAIGTDGRLRETGRTSNQIGVRGGDPGVLSTYFAAINPAGTFLYEQDAGGYRLTPDGRVSASALPPGSMVEPNVGDAWGITLSPSGRFAFVVTSKPDGAAGDNTPSGSLVMPLRVSHDGGLVPLSGSQAAPAPKSLIPTNGGLVVDPSGRFLLLYSTIPSLIARYRIEVDGSLASLGVTSTNGQPVALTFGPGGRTVYALNRYYNSVTTFRLDDGGGLTKVGLDTPNGGPFVAGFALADVPTPQKWGPAEGGVEVSARLEREVFTVDAPVALTVVLRNVTTHAVALGKVGADMASFHLVLTGPHRQSPGVLGPGGEPAAEAIPLLAAGQDLLGMPSPSSTPLVLPPGAQRQYRLVLSRLADLSVAGNYTVQVSRALPGGSVAVSPMLRLRLDNLYDGLSIYSPEWRPGLRSAEQVVEIL